VTLLQSELDSLWRFVVERDRVRVRRASSAPPPWTDDPIIATCHFTNVHRWQDPGTQWIMAYVRAFWTPDPDELLFTLVAYRTINRVATFERFGFPSRDHRGVDAWNKALSRAREEGWKVGSRRHQTSLDRTIASLHWLIDHPQHADTVWAARDGVEAVGALSKVSGLGPFYAIQVVGDLLTIGGSQLGLVMGDDPVTSLAVGSRSALHILMGGIDPTVFVPNDQSGWRRSLARLWRLDDNERDALHELHQSQPSELSSPLTFVDIEHSLCEWNRYHKLAIGDPRIGRRVTRSGALSGSGRHG
jgi:hypothetical protein